MVTIEQFSFPLDLYYHPRSHVWLRQDGDIATLGLDVMGVDTFGDIAYVSLLPVGTVLEQNQPAGTVEAAKMVDDFLSPVSGTIVEHNTEVVTDPSLVNNDPYGEGWIVKIKTSSAWDAETAELVYGEAVQDWAKAEVERLKE